MERLSRFFFCNTGCQTFNDPSVHSYTVAVKEANRAATSAHVACPNLAQEEQGGIPIAFWARQVEACWRCLARQQGPAVPPVTLLRTGGAWRAVRRPWGTLALNSNRVHGVTLLLDCAAQSLGWRGSGWSRYPKSQAGERHLGLAIRRSENRLQTLTCPHPWHCSSQKSGVEIRETFFIYLQFLKTHIILKQHAHHWTVLLVNIHLFSWKFTTGYGWYLAFYLKPEHLHTLVDFGFRSEPEDCLQFLREFPKAIFWQKKISKSHYPGAAISSEWYKSNIAWPCLLLRFIYTCLGSSLWFFHG